MKLSLEKLLTVDETGMPKAPTLRQLQLRATRELWSRDKSKDKSKYIAEVGVIYYLADPKSPARQQGLSYEETLAMAIDNYNLPKDYKPDKLVTSLAELYYKDCITEAGVAVEAVQKSLHLVSVSASKINETLKRLLEGAIEVETITSILKLIDSINSKVSELPSLIKAMNVAHENLLNETEETIARGKKKILSSMIADDNEL